MDKIQNAIAKARASRPEPNTVRIGTETPAVAVARPATESEAPARDQVEPQATPMVQAPTAAEVDARWDALPLEAPQAKTLARNRIMTLNGGKEATEFDILRTRILQQAKLNGWRKIAITSPGPGCGKSTLTLNLAFSLARQPDQRTWVAEMDMRRPNLAQTVGLKKGHRFASVLEGIAPFEEHSLRLDDRMMLSANTSNVAQASELLQSRRAAKALTDIMHSYDPTIALFDMPPLLAGDDTMAFLSQVDCAILVAAAEQSSIKQIDICERDIASQTNVMGVVLNKCRYIDRDNTYGYY